MTLLVRIHQGPLPRSTCRHCSEALVWDAEVGWFDPAAHHSYDMCPRDLYANHDGGAVPGVPRGDRVVGGARYRS
ncbi:hypothetical protein [Nocardioides marmotae]|uniref:hypothetical protein n=1 Tax=Nocardioides marmotae TaxID=2663857 RepID=UPI0012B671CB|nr:hypothetical protein [Nocardioides marmotae]MBC9733025.1 hypothetical protein [Nocardioides marmotae]MTB84139.1 hypothetical protein [Nocardioides marmotae]